MLSEQGNVLCPEVHQLSITSLLKLAVSYSEGRTQYKEQNEKNKKK